MKDDYVRRAVVTSVCEDGKSIIADIDLGYGVYKHKQHFCFSRIDTPLNKHNNRTVYKSEKALNKELRVWLESILTGNEVWVKSELSDKQNRYIAELWVHIDDKIMHLNQYMINHGLAKQYNPDGEDHMIDGWSLSWFRDSEHETNYKNWKQSLEPDTTTYK